MVNLIEAVQVGVQVAIIVGLVNGLMIFIENKHKEGKIGEE